MAKSAILSANAEDQRFIIHHEEDGRTYIESREDVSALVKAAQILADEPPGKDFRRVGFIPKTVLDAAFNEGWFHDVSAWKRWSNASENACYRTWFGKL